MKNIASSEGRCLALLHRQLMKQLERELGPLKLGSGRYLYLLALYIQDGRRQQEFADGLALDKAAVTRSLARLEQDGYIRRAADELDRRASRVYLTDKGRALSDILLRAVETSTDAITAPLTSQERETFRVLLEKRVMPYIDG